MTDIAPEDTFTALSQAAEAAAIEADGGQTEEFYPVEAVEPAGTEAGDEQPSEGRRRDDQGRFVADTPDEAEAEAAVEGEQQQQLQTDEEFFLARYRSREDAERGVAEKDRYIEQLKAEKAAYERWYAEQQQAMQQPQIPVGFDWEEMLAEDPVAAADFAVEHRNEYAYRQALAAIEDQQGPSGRRVYLQLAQVREAQRELAQRVQPVQQREAEQRKMDALLAFNAENPWFASIPDDELVNVFSQNPHLAAQYARQDPDTLPDVLFAAGVQALRARSAANGVVNEQVQDLARAQATEAQRAREEAFVPSSQTATAQTPVTAEQSEKERTEAAWAAERSKWANGWDRPAALDAEAELQRLRRAGRI